MQQSPKLKIALFFSFLFLSAGNTFATVVFTNTDLEIIKADAGEEGKLYFVNFTAKWCAPCKFMEEYTYTDDRLSAYIDKNYIAVKYDINSIDGFGYKRKYDVQSIPAIVVFNSKGEMVGKYETSMSAGKMQFVLEDHDIPANRVKIPRKVAPKPIPEVKPEPIKEVKRLPVVEVKPEITKPTIPQEREVILTAKGGTTLTSKFTVQVGAFEIYDNVYNESERLRLQLSEITRIHPATHSDDQYNRLYVGDFDTYEAAYQFRYQLEQAGLEAMVKQLRY